VKESRLFAALNLPATALVLQRIPKNVLVKNGAPTPGDKRKINDGIEELQWLAALKPNTIGVPKYRDSVREYLEISIIGVNYRNNANAGRLNELIHRAIPYPVVLITFQDEKIGISLVHKRWAQNEAGAVVLDGDHFQVNMDEGLDQPTMDKFYQAMSLNGQPQGNMLTLYRGWIDTVVSLQAACKTGRFQQSHNREQALARHAVLQEYNRLEAMMTHLRTLALKEKQIPKLVKLNLELKELEAELLILREKL